MQTGDSPVPGRATQWWTLRRVLIAVVLAVTSVAASVMVGSALLAISWRDAGEREAHGYLEDQRAVYEVVKLTSDEEMAAHRVLHGPNGPDGPNGNSLEEFRTLGDSAYRTIHNYLFRDLTTDVRLKAEALREAHEGVEVAAKRTFDLVSSGQSQALLVRLDSMDIRAKGLQDAASALLVARTAQRDTLQHRYEALSLRLRSALVIMALALAILGVLLALLLRRLVLRPLNQLEVAAQRIGDGDAGARVPAQAFPEFDTVAAGFNQMAERVQHSGAKSLAQNKALQEALDHLKETQEELVQLEKLSAMGQMLAGLAHELNNPLAGVLGLAEGLRTELAESPDARTRAIGVELAVPLEREALRARALVGNLLSFSRKSADTLQPIDLSSAVETAAALRRHSFVEIEKELVVSVPAGIHVMADAQKLQMAVVNVINNALDAIVENGGSRLEVHVRLEEEVVFLDFDDDGPGFSDAAAAFRPFYTTKETGKGTGLGLSLVHRFMTEFGGTVSATNRGHGGARISLAFRASPPAASPVTVTEVATTVPEPVVSVPVLIARISRILIVDDESALRNIESRVLKRAGYDVTTAASGEEARDFMLGGSFDLVISDFRMPGAMDGGALIAWMKIERPALARNALLVTGDLSGAEYSTLPLPASRTLVKPFLASELVARAAHALSTAAAEA